MTSLSKCQKIKYNVLDKTKRPKLPGNTVIPEILIKIMKSSMVC